MHFRTRLDLGFRCESAFSADANTIYMKIILKHVRGNDEVKNPVQDFETCWIEQRFDLTILTFYSIYKYKYNKIYVYFMPTTLTGTPQ